MGQVFVAQGDVFGSGPITLGTTEEAALLARDVDVAVPNKVIFSRSTSYVNGFTQSVPGKGRLTLTSVGTPADATSHAIRLGRSSGWRMRGTTRCHVAQLGRRRRISPPSSNGAAHTCRVNG